MQRLLPILICSLGLLSACATSTPIAVRTPTYHVPAPPPQLVQAETQALSISALSLKDWRSVVMSLPTLSDNSAPPSKGASATATH